MWSRGVSSKGNFEFIFRPKFLLTPLTGVLRPGKGDCCAKERAPGEMMTPGQQPKGASAGEEGETAVQAVQSRSIGRQAAAGDGVWRKGG